MPMRRSSGARCRPCAASSSSCAADRDAPAAGSAPARPQRAAARSCRSPTGRSAPRSRRPPAPSVAPSTAGRRARAAVAHRHRFELQEHRAYDNDRCGMRIGSYFTGPRPVAPAMRRAADRAVPAAGAAGAGRAGGLAASSTPAALATLWHQVSTVLPGYALQSARARRRRGAGRDAARRGDRRGGDAVRLSRPARTSNGRCCCRWRCRPMCWPTPGPTRCSSAARCRRRCATRWALQRRPVARCAQPGRRGGAVRAGALPLRLSAHAHRAGRARARSCWRPRGCSAPACAGACWRWRCRWRGRRSRPAWRWR